MRELQHQLEEKSLENERLSKELQEELDVLEQVGFYFILNVNIVFWAYLL